jgi:hypothetical protein
MYFIELVTTNYCIDVTYFFELLGITNTFDISAALFSLSVLMCMVGFFTIEVLPMSEYQLI